MVVTNSISAILYERYFGETMESIQTPYISSHWDQESNYLGAIRSKDGRIKPQSIDYWGCTLDSLKSRFMDKMQKYAHFPHLGNKIAVSKLMRTAKTVCDRMGLDTTHTVFRQVCTIELINRYLSTIVPEERLRIIVIGDGIGVLSALFREVVPNSSITLVDLGKTLLYQAYHCGLAHPDKQHSLIGDGSDFIQSDFIYCPTENLDELSGLEFDVAVNIASMGEMNSSTVARYFKFLRNQLRSQNLFYCCNRETKVMPGGEVSEFAYYPWKPTDEIIVDGECPWHRYTIGHSDSSDRPRMFGIKIPFLQYYDGIIRHRLTTLASA